MSGSDPNRFRKELLVGTLTPPGRGAVAVLCVSGPNAAQLVSRLCDWGDMSSDRVLTPGELRVARWGQPDGEQVVLYVKDPDEVEISCHGGSMAIESLLACLARHGVRSLSWSQLARRRAEPTSSIEAVEALASAPTLAAANILLDQFHGSLANEVSRLQKLLEHRVRNDVARELQVLLDRSRVGMHLVEPWFVAIVGRPNVGKSSMLNALAGYRRAIVDPTSGTTRDLVTALTAVAGWPVQLCDTAGIGPGSDQLEREGVRRARQAIEQSDGQLVVLDRSGVLTGEDYEIVQDCRHALVVANKVDLPAVWDAQARFADSVAVSAKTGEGMDRLIGRLAHLLVPRRPEPGDPVPFTLRQVELLQAARQHVAAGQLDRAGQRLAELR